MGSSSSTAFAIDRSESQDPIPVNVEKTGKVYEMHAKDDQYDRRKINCASSNTWAWQTIVNIGGYCSGTLISSDVVLTAAHCVFDPELWTWLEPTWIKAHPCKSNDVLDSPTYDWKEMIVFKGWAEHGKFDLDLAAVKLTEEPGKTNGWKSFGFRSWSQNIVFNVAGYSRKFALDPITMWTSANRLCRESEFEICRNSDHEIQYISDVHDNKGGSGIYLYNANLAPKRILYGVHSHSQSYDDVTKVLNVGSRIKAATFYTLCVFINSPVIC